MIIEIKEEKKSSTFLDYMFFQEKDDEEPQRRNMKVINLKTSDKRRQDFTKGADVGESEEEESEETTDEENSGDEPVTDEEDYSDNDEGDTGDNSDDTSNDSSDSSDENEKVEQFYKYNLYQKFQKVLISLQDYSSELDNIVSDDAETNHKYKKLTAKLKETQRLMEEYMIIKFNKASFAQSMLFYQRVITNIDIAFQEIQKQRKKELKAKMNS